MSSFAAVLPPERNRYFGDTDGVLASVKRYDETVPLIVDWSDALPPGETISSVAYSDSGVTRSSTSNTATSTTTYVTGCGETEITVTSAPGGVILQRVVRFYATDRAPTSDYR